MQSNLQINAHQGAGSRLLKMLMGEEGQPESEKIDGDTSTRPEIKALDHVLEAVRKALTPWGRHEDLSAVIDGLYLDDAFQENSDVINRIGVDLILKERVTFPDPAKLLPEWQAFLAGRDLAEVSVLLEEYDQLRFMYLTDEVRPRVTPGPEARQVLNDFLYDLDTPPEIAEAVMGSFRADIVLIFLLDSYRNNRMMRPGQVSGLLSLLRSSLEGSRFLLRLALHRPLSEQDEAKLLNCERYSLIMRYGPEVGARLFAELGAQGGA